ncbi:unannotated protein [freshwater metagenome]|uniref:Unannotated protein n=1 Tax=freshwater metagenome TaxID=449393 RepID=A0A6J7LPF3_9ZZZZ
MTVVVHGVSVSPHKVGAPTNPSGSHDTFCGHATSVVARTLSDAINIPPFRRGRASLALIVLYFPTLDGLPSSPYAVVMRP